MENSGNGFPDNFLWGAATSAYQIEGAATGDGRGRSTWDEFCDEPGRVRNGDSGAVACDHYSLWKDDIGLMRELNLAAYRFSLSWPRILPDGDGLVNAKGLAFYDRLIDGLLEAGIQPWVTLFHWDLPWSLQERFGGWRSRETAYRFADYAALCARSFGDRVKNWFTINEIMCFTVLAHRDDRFAPGGRLPDGETNQTVHHALLGHGLALRALRSEHPDIRAGLVENLDAVWPVWDRPDHVEAARRAFRDRNQQRLFPAMRGIYEPELYERFHGRPPVVEDGDLEIIGTRGDFIAYNYYHATPIAATGDGDLGWTPLRLPENQPHTEMGWPITPEGLYWTLRFSAESFPDVPVYIAENGCAMSDTEERDGAVNDVGRIQYHRSHLEACSRAVAEGVPLRGYFAWSLMDNFEWTEGYSRRFGLVRVNFRTGKRTIKASGRYFTDVIRANRVL